MDEGFDTSTAQMGALPARVVHIFTLGRFDIHVNGCRVLPKGKARHRPNALLMLLVANGGRCVSCRKISEGLWPDSDGDMSSRNLTITLHRLRQQLGGNAVISCHENKLSLNEELCWTDTWQFESLSEQALKRAGSCPVDETGELLLRSALDLYAGQFLGFEAEESWMIEPRIRWRSRFERIVATLTTHFERHNRFDDAIDLCLEALEIDPFNEFLYRRLMNCYLMRGENAAAIRIYTNCRDALMKGLATQPSVETDRLYRSALEQGCSFKPKPEHRLSGSLA